MDRSLPNIRMEPISLVLQCAAIWYRIHIQPISHFSGRLLQSLPIWRRWVFARSLRGPYNGCALHLGSLWDHINDMRSCHIVETSLHDFRQWSWRYYLYVLAYRLNTIEMLPKRRRLCRKHKRLHWSGWRRKELDLGWHDEHMHWKYMHTLQFVRTLQLVTRRNSGLERRHLCSQTRLNCGR